MRIIFSILLLLPVLAGIATGEEVVLKDGRILYGEVRKQGEDVVLVDYAGRSVVLGEEIQEIRGLDDLRKEYASMVEREGAEANHFSMGVWCWKRGLREESRKHFNAIIEKDPDNPAARWALGQVKVRGIWVTEGVWTKLPGPEKAWVRYVPEGAKGRLEVRQEPQHDARNLLRELCSGSESERKSADSALAAMPPEVRREGFLLSLDDRSAAIRAEAAARLSSFKGLEVAKPLARAAIADSEKKVREAAVKSLLDGSYPEARDLLMAGIASKNLTVRLNSIAALASFPAQDTVNALATVLGSATPHIPHANIFVGRQVAYVKDFDVEVAAFAGIGDPIMGTAIEGSVLDVKVLSTEVRTIRIQRRTAWSSLCAIAGKDLGMEAEVWRKWGQERFGKS